MGITNIIAVLEYKSLHSNNTFTLISYDNVIYSFNLLYVKYFGSILMFHASDSFDFSNCGILK